MRLSTKVVDSAKVHSEVAVLEVVKVCAEFESVSVPGNREVSAN